MNILFITSTRIGDAVLSTGILDHMARSYPDALVTVVCGPLTASLFEGYPNIREIIPLKKKKYNGHWVDLWRRVRRKDWDMIVDLRNSALSRFIRAGHKFIYSKRIDQSLHKVEQNAAVMGLNYIPAPKLWFTTDQMARARALMVPGGKILAVGPTANWRAKTWPRENFIEVIKYVTTEKMPGARVTIFAARGEEEDARAVLESIPADRRIDMIAKGDPGTAAAVLSMCDFYIGNDSGLMHMAAAAGVKTLGLFGPSYPHLYRPWGAHCYYVSTPQTFDQLIDYNGYSPKTAPCLMGGLSAEDVIKKIKSIPISFP
jgi:heptosyltransferase-3